MAMFPTGGRVAVDATAGATVYTIVGVAIVEGAVGAGTIDRPMILPSGPDIILFEFGLRIVGR